jgi:hypothetical protein
MAKPLGDHIPLGGFVFLEVAYDDLAVSLIAIYNRRLHGPKSGTFGRSSFRVDRLPAVSCAGRFGDAPTDGAGYTRSSSSLTQPNNRKRVRRRRSTLIKLATESTPSRRSLNCQAPGQHSRAVLPCLPASHRPDCSAATRNAVTKPCALVPVAL